MDISLNNLKFSMYLIGHKNVPNTSLVNYLQQELICDIPIVGGLGAITQDLEQRDATLNAVTSPRLTESEQHSEPNQNPEHPTVEDNQKLKNHYFLLVDCYNMNSARCNRLFEHCIYNYHTSVQLYVALLNVEKKSALEQLISWPILSGIFYKDDDPAHICKGIVAIQDGALWFSRRLLKTYLTQHRQQMISSSIPFAHNLTKRERQILRLSSTGAKNSEIAGELRLSPNTIKTHMYNLFKKLNVDNRIQAINSAKQYLQEFDS